MANETVSAYDQIATGLGITFDLSDDGSLQNIGQGACGSVYSAGDSVVKIIDPGGLGSYESELILEGKTLRHVTSASKGFCSTDEKIYAVRLRKLRGYIHFNEFTEKGYPTEIKKQVLRQLAEGLSDLHEANVDHYDLNGENILIKVEGDEVDVQIIDFSHAKPLTKLSAAIIDYRIFENIAKDLLGEEYPLKGFYTPLALSRGLLSWDKILSHLS